MKKYVHNKLYSSRAVVTNMSFTKLRMLNYPKTVNLNLVLSYFMSRLSLLKKKLVDNK